MEYKQDGCYKAVCDVLKLIGGASDTSHYVRIMDVYTGRELDRVNAADDLKAAGPLSEVLKFAQAEGNGLCIAGLDAHTEGDKTIWTVSAYYVGALGEYAVTRGDPDGTQAGAVLAYRWDRAARAYLWDTDVYTRGRERA
jgi:hypothetical protein